MVILISYYWHISSMSKRIIHCLDCSRFHNFVLPNYCNFNTTFSHKCRILYILRCVKFNFVFLPL